MTIVSGLAGMASIAFVLPGLRQGGAEIVTLRLAAAFSELGHRVAVVSVRSGMNELPPRESGAIDYVFLEASHTRLAILPLWRFIRSWRPEIVVSAQPHLSLLAILVRAAIRPRFKLVVTEHALIGPQIEQTPNWASKLLPAMIRLLYPLADCAVTVSDGITREIRTLAPRVGCVRRIYNPIFDHSLA